MIERYARTQQNRHFGQRKFLHDDPNEAFEVADFQANRVFGHFYIVNFTPENAEGFHNDMNFPIVPQNFYMPTVMLTARAADDLYKQGHGLEADAMMFGAFHQGGSLEYQCGGSYGIPPYEIDLATVDSASFMFGFTTELAGIPPEDAEKAARKYTKVKNGSTATGPFGMNPRDYKEFAAGYDFAREAANDPHSSIYRMMKAFGLGEPKRTGQSKPVAPMAPLVRPGHAGGQKQADNDDTVPATFGRFFHTKSSEPDFQHAVAGGPNWMHQADGAAGSNEPGHAPLFSPFKERQTGETVFTALVTRSVRGGEPRPGSRSFAPVGANLAQASRGSLWEPAKIASGGRGIERFSDQMPWRLSGDVLGTRKDTDCGSGLSGPSGGSEAEFLDAEPRVRLSELGLSQTLNEFFRRQARLAPSGGAAFDPRLTPAWAGLKLPV